MQNSLSKTIEKLKTSKQVVGIFTTGSSSTGLKPYSDIDLVVILNKNSEKIKSIYTMVDNHFADIFFFDLDFLKQIQLKKTIPTNSFEGIFITWLSKAKIYYDTSGILTKYKKAFSAKKMFIADNEKQEWLTKINYSYIANKRYYGAKDKLYSRALELRLAHSVIELCTTYCALRNIGWRGEKAFITYLQKHDKKYLKNLLDYFNSKSLKAKVGYYGKLFTMTLTPQYKKWGKDFFIINSARSLNTREKIKIRKTLE